ncbi:MAG: iron chelate uptake ABC transporter family permease subunit [Clostridia bacterium]
MNLNFALLNDYTFQIVVIGSTLLGIISGTLGCFTVLQKQSLLGDGVSHATLPGVVLAFILTNSKDNSVLLIGAFISGLISTLVINGITKYSKIKFDSALSATLSVFFGFGMALLSYSQKIPNSNQAGLSNFIFGQSASMLKKDVYVLLITGCVLLFIVFLLWKEFKLLSFDPEYLQTIGFSTKKLNILLLTMIVIAIVLGIQTVGVILMSALLVSPAVSARQWTDKLSTMVILSATFGAFSSIMGTMISSSTKNLATGPVIVICASIITAFSVLFAPKRGVFAVIIQRRKNKRNFLKLGVK